MSFSRAAYFAATVTLIAAAVNAPATAQEPSAPAPQPAAPQQSGPPAPALQPAPAPQQAPTPAPAPKPFPAPKAPRPTPPPGMPPPAVLPPLVKLPAGVAARVNGADLTYDALAAMLKSWGGRPLLERAVQAKVIELEAKKYGATVTAAELKAEVARAKQDEINRLRDSGAGMMPWSEIAARNGVSDGYVADNVRLGLLARKTFQKAIEKNIPSIVGQIKVAHILIPTVDLAPPKPDATPKTPEEEAKRDAEAKAKAEGILADIVAKKITFEDAARQFSADKTPNGQGSAPNGGVLPYTGRSLWDPAFDKAAFDLAKPGDMTPSPIRSRVGYHIIKLIQKGTDAPAAEKAAYNKEQVAIQSQNPQAVTQWVQYLMSTAKVSYGASAAPAPKKPSAKPASTAKTP